MSKWTSEVNGKIDKNNTSNTARVGATFCELLGIAFIILKLCGVITWSWGWVFAPIWMPWVVALVLWVLALVVVIVKSYKNSRKKTEKRG